MEADRNLHTGRRSPKTTQQCPGQKRVIGIPGEMSHHLGPPRRDMGAQRLERGQQVDQPTPDPRVPLVTYQRLCRVLADLIQAARRRNRHWIQPDRQLAADPRPASGVKA